MTKSKKSEMVVEVPVAEMNDEFVAEVTESMLPAGPAASLPPAEPTEAVEEVPELAGSAGDAVPPVVEPIPAPPVVEDPTPAPVVPATPASMSVLLDMLKARGVDPTVAQEADGSWLITGSIDHVFFLARGPYAGGCHVLSISIKTRDSNKNHYIELRVQA